MCNCWYCNNTCVYLQRVSEADNLNHMLTALHNRPVSYFPGYIVQDSPHRACRPGCVYGCLDYTELLFEHMYLSIYYNRTLVADGYNLPGSLVVSQSTYQLFYRLDTPKGCFHKILRDYLFACGMLDCKWQTFADNYMMRYRSSRVLMASWMHTCPCMMF